jgi:hypothetical protein
MTPTGVLIHSGSPGFNVPTRGDHQPVTGPYANANRVTFNVPNPGTPPARPVMHTTYEGPVNTGY